MNILFFSRLFYPHIGGVEKHVLEISRLLVKKGYKVIVVTEQHEKKIKISEEFQGIRIYRIPPLKEGWLKKFKIWKWLWRHRELISNADIIHCHDVFFWYLPFRFLYFAKRVFTTFHGYENYPLKSKDILIRKIAEKLSKGNICIGHFIEKWYGTKSTFITYGGAEISNFIHSANSEQISNQTKQESAIFIGRLDEQTGILTYVKAVEIIKKTIPNFDFLIIGDGKLKSAINKKIKILNARENASKYYNEYNFAFASGYLSILEALAAKKLVFAVYDNPLKEDYLKLSPFSKFVTVCNSTSELVSKIIFYLNNVKKQEKITEGAYEWVKNHTWEEVVSSYLKLWKL